MNSGSTARYTSTAAATSGMSSAGSAGSVGNPRRARDALIVARVVLLARQRPAVFRGFVPRRPRGPPAGLACSCRKVADDLGRRQPLVLPILTWWVRVTEGRPDARQPRCAGGDGLPARSLAGRAFVPH